MTWQKVPLALNLKVFVHFGSTRVSVLSSWARNLFIIESPSTEKYLSSGKNCSGSILAKMLWGARGEGVLHRTSLPCRGNHYTPGVFMLSMGRNCSLRGYRYVTLFLKSCFSTLQNYLEMEEMPVVSKRAKVNYNVFNSAWLHYQVEKRK